MSMEASENFVENDVNGVSGNAASFDVLSYRVDKN